MKKILSAVLLAAALAVPVVASADQPSRLDKHNATTECKALLRAEGNANFKHAWGRKGRGRAYGNCVRSKAREELTERSLSRSEAISDCRTERAMSDDDFKAGHEDKTFAEFYNAPNAHSGFGHCVATHAKENKSEFDAHDQDVINAARFCHSHQGDEGFSTTYRNFGACVSQKAHELNEQRQESLTEAA